MFALPCPKCCHCSGLDQILGKVSLLMSYPQSCLGTGAKLFSIQYMEKQPYLLHNAVTVLVWIKY